MATLLILVDRCGLLLAWRLFRRASLITRLLGRNGLRAASKVASLLLAAIAVKLIREGLSTFPLIPSS